MNFDDPKWIGVVPRAWQREAMARIVAHYSPCTAKPAVISAVMGSGKSILIAEACACARGEGVIVVSTPTELLVRDLYHAIKKRCGMDVGIWYGRRKSLGRVIVTCAPSLRTLSQRLSNKGLRCLLWIADEAHKTEAESVLDAYEALIPNYVLGFTATPYRAEKEHSLSIFEECLYRYGIAEAQRDGVIVSWRIEHFRKDQDLDEGCAEWIAGQSTPGIVNAFDCDDADQFAKSMNAAGVKTAAIHSKRPLRSNLDAVAALEQGWIRCAVHVNMLSEGANYPWLRWMVLRRQVGSRVRFLQEIGRLLRSCPGKSEAVFLDPHDLFGAFRLTYAEALGERPPELEMEEPEALEPGELIKMIDQPDEALALSWIESFVRSIVVRIEMLGWPMGRRKILSREHRTKPATGLQICAVSNALRVAAHIIPADWHGVLDAVLSRPHLIRFGFAADLVLALGAVAKAGTWPGLGYEVPVKREESGQLIVDFGRLA